MLPLQAPLFPGVDVRRRSPELEIDPNRRARQVDVELENPTGLGVVISNVPTQRSSLEFSEITFTIQAASQIVYLSNHLSWHSYIISKQGLVCNPDLE